MKLISIIGGALLIILSFCYLTNANNPDLSLDTITSESDSIKTKIISRENYTFKAPPDWIDSEVDFEGCVWDSISHPGNGHRMSGEIAIYPSSCFDLTNAVGYSEFTEKENFYIVAYYDKASGVTEEEANETKKVYKTVIETFVAKQ